MSKLREFFNDNPNIAISIPAILCFIQFVYEVIEIIETRDFDANAFSQLCSSANGFEAVVLFGIMFVLKRKDK
jgi:hypothetical protein